MRYGVETMQREGFADTSKENGHAKGSRLIKLETHHR
jgi:hypothetical protein